MSPNPELEVSHVHHKKALRPSSLTSTLLVAALIAAPAALAEEWFDLSVTGDISLGRSLTAMNEQLQLRYAEDGRLAALADPRPHDFATVAIVSSDVPSMPDTLLESDSRAFGPPVFDGATLNSSLDLLNYAIATRGTDLFLQIAADATQKQHTFATVALSIDTHNAVEQYQYALLGDSSDFGHGVQDDASLERSITDLNQLMNQAGLRNQLLAGAVPEVTGASMDRYLASAHLLY